MDRGDELAAREVALGLEIEEHTLRFGADHHETLVSMIALAANHRERGDFERARSIEERVLATLERDLVPGHPHILTVARNLALTMSLLGDRVQSAELLERMIDAATEALGPGHAETIVTIEHLSSCLRAQGRLEEALQQDENACWLLECTLGESDPRTIASMQALADARWDTGNRSDARGLLGHAMVLLARVHGGMTHPEVLPVVRVLAQMHQQGGDLEFARMLVELLKSVPYEEE